VFHNSGGRIFENPDGSVVAAKSIECERMDLLGCINVDNGILHKSRNRFRSVPRYPSSEFLMSNFELLESQYFNEKIT